MAPPLHELDIRPEIAGALAAGRAVVALESTLIAHGLPWPLNRETAQAAEAAVRAAGAVPATIAVLTGRPTIGLTESEIAALAQDRSVRKASRRDLAAAVALRQTAATTVAATMALAEIAGIRVFATGGIGGAHRTQHEPAAPARELTSWDVSADLQELAQTPVAVVCAGAKSILDIPRTLELLETLSVPVIGFGCGEFPSFYLRSTNEPVSARVDDAISAAKLLAAHWGLGGHGVVIAQPVGADVALDAEEFEAALGVAEQRAGAAGIRGAAVTPFLLAQLADLTNGKTLRANRALIVANARLAAEIAVALARL